MAELSSRLAITQAPEIRVDPFFRRTLQTFFSYTNENDVVVDTILRNLPIYGATSYERLCRGGTWSFLDIGGGPGSKTFAIVKTLVELTHGRIEVTNVDPSSEWNKEYVAEAKRHGLGHLIKEVHCARWEDYVSDKQYDFVLCSHSLYGISEWQGSGGRSDSLNKIRESVQPSGTACIVIQSDENVIYKVQEKFLPQIHSANQQAVSGKMVETALKQLGIRYHLIGDVSEVLDVCFLDLQSRPLAEEKAKVLSLMLLLSLAEYYRLPPGLRRNVEEFIRQIGSQVPFGIPGGICENRGPHRLVDIGDDFIWIGSEKVSA